MNIIIIGLIHIIVLCIIVLTFKKVFTKLTLASNRIKYLEQRINEAESFNKESLSIQAKALDQLTKKINSKFKLS
jgi:F0F1-type ATP synthase membrane subunit b/b'